MEWCGMGKGSRIGAPAKFGDVACRCRMVGYKGCSRVFVSSAGALWLWYAAWL